MDPYKKQIAFLFLFVLFCLITVPQGGAAPITVLKDIICGCAETDAACSIDKAISSGYNPIYVKPATNPACPYYNPITITGAVTAVTIIGLTSSGQKAWTSGTAGASASGPTIKQKSPHEHLIKISGASNVTIAGFNLEGRGATVTGTALYGNVNKITLTYNTFNIGQKQNEDEKKYNTARGISIDYNSAAYNLTVNNCKFVGQVTNTGNWLFVGNSSGGGSIGNAVLSNNTISNCMATVLLARPLTNTQISNNTFENNWNTTLDDTTISNLGPYGYIYIDEPTEIDNNIIRGLTITHNTFKDSTGSGISKEFAIVLKDIETNNAGSSNWQPNFAIHSNNFLQSDTGQNSYPIVGFKNNSPAQTSDITATSNWWKSTSGPGAYDTTSGTAANVSQYVSYKPWARAEISGGAYATVPADAYLYEITGTQMLKNNMSFQVSTKTTGAVTFVPTKYTSCPTGTSLPSGVNGIIYFDLGIKSGGENIHAITTTFYAPSGSTLASTNPLYFYNGVSWQPCHVSVITKTTSARTFRTADVSNTYIDHSFSGYVTAFITKTARFITPTLNSITRTGINISVPTRTFFALVGTGGSTTTSSTTTTTTSGSGGGGTTSSSSSSSSTSSTSTSIKPTTTSSSVKPTTTSTSTTTTIPPKLSVSPASLTFDDNDTAQQISISNTGAGTLTWQISDNATTYTGDTEGWLFAASPRSGSVTNKPQSVTILVSRSGVPAGSYTATLPITSNGGSKNLPVNMNVTQSELPLPIVSTRLLVFNTGDTTKTFTIRNLSSGSVTWEIDEIVYNRSRGWLTVTPNLGYTRAETDTVTVTVDRENAGKGLYSAVIPVRTNTGTVNVGVIMLVQEGPVTKVQPSFLLFLNKKDTVKGFAITNTGSGTMTWSIGTPEYKGGSGWISSITPMAGTINAGDEPSVVSVAVTREGLISGLYRADIPIASNGGDRKVIVLLLVTPF
ncbi:MAG: hypothetical protein N3B18_01500 [Desulfobacterota bacterium]|nr:hypothetical protein [Thermodesulfobacteriota bacterium]